MMTGEFGWFSGSVITEESGRNWPSFFVVQKNGRNLHLGVGIMAGLVAGSALRFPGMGLNECVIW